MRVPRVLVFLIIVLLIYGSVNFYLGRRGVQGLSASRTAQHVFLALFLVLVLAYPVGRTLQALGRTGLAAPLIKVGSFHMVFMLYGFLAVVAMDLVRLIQKFIPFLPRPLAAANGRALFLAVVLFVALTTAAGAWNAARVRLIELDIPIGKPAGGLSGLRIVAASDLHLGALIGVARLERLVERANALKPDIVLLAGDVVDETVTDPLEEKLSEIMKRLRAPLGVFAVAGNHEFYSGLERNLACLRSCGIRVLEDEAVLIDDAFVIAGRKDPSSLKPGERRRSVAEILSSSGIAGGRPVILLDHQPIDLDEPVRAGVDLQISGHTHAGQLFPLDIINRMVWRLHHGYLRRDGTHIYVSSGVGTWGPPVRTGSRSEIVLFRLTFGSS